MTRVPPSNRPAPPPKIFKPKRPKHVEEKHEVIREEKVEGQVPEVTGEHVLKTHEEHAQKHAEAMGWTSESHGEAEDKKADKEEQVANAERDENSESGEAHHIKQAAKAAVAAHKAQQGGLNQQKKDEFKFDSNKAAQQQQKVKPLTDLGGTVGMGAKDSLTAVKTTDAVREAAERALRSGKPLDAFALLNQAQPHGFFFKEDYEREGHTEDKDDPELAAAVEETIRVLFGVRGIIRVGPGLNQAGEPVIIVVVGQGFGEASMMAVPSQVHRFTTLLALPFEVLPLKKER